MKIIYDIFQLYYKMIFFLPLEEQYVDITIISIVKNYRKITITTSFLHLIWTVNKFLTDKKSRLN